MLLERYIYKLTQMLCELSKKIKKQLTYTQNCRNVVNVTGKKSIFKFRV